MGDHSDRVVAIAGAALQRALAAWQEHDVGRAIHPADREAIRATEAIRALVLELFTRPSRDLYNACAQLGRLLADSGGSPSLAASTIDGAVKALDHVEIAHEPARIPAARASVLEAYVAAVREAVRDEGRRTWDPPACIVPLDEHTVAIAAGVPTDDRERLAEWAAMVAKAVARRSARVAVVVGSEPARRELDEALGLVGVEATEHLPTRG